MSHSKTLVSQSHPQTLVADHQKTEQLREFGFLLSVPGTWKRRIRWSLLIRCGKEALQWLSLFKVPPNEGQILSEMTWDFSMSQVTGWRQETGFGEHKMHQVLFTRRSWHGLVLHPKNWPRYTFSAYSILKSFCKNVRFTSDNQQNASDGELPVEGDV